jgi:hypothetical protein
MTANYDYLAGASELEFKDDLDIPVDFYLVRFVKAVQDQQKGHWGLCFLILKGEYAGMKYWVLKFNPSYAPDDTKAKQWGPWLRKWCIRLGMLTEEMLGKPWEPDWRIPVGKDFVLQIEEREDDDPRDPSKKVKKRSPGYLGIWPVTHENIKVSVRVQLGLPLLEGQVVPPPKPPSEPPAPAAPSPPPVPPAGPVPMKSVLAPGEI